MFLFNRKPVAKKYSIYLDNASATAVDVRILDSYLKVQKEHFANPGSIHTLGIEAKDQIKSARKKVAKHLEVRMNEIIFTSSGTESNNLAIHGVLHQVKKEGGALPHVITTSIEHASVLEPLKRLAKEEVIELSIVPVNEKGIVEIKAIRELLTKNTMLVSVIHANNEIGTIQPVREIGKMLEKYREANQTRSPYFHVDACQAVNYAELRPEAFRIDLCTFNSSKIYAPRGAGVLYVASRVKISPMIEGGDQENGFRAGTENTSAIVACADAFEKTISLRESEKDRLGKLQKYTFFKLKESIPNIKIWGSEDGNERIPNNINISVPGIFSEEFVVSLDMVGIYVSSKSACGMSNDDGSYVIKAIGGTDKESKESVRISMGRDTTTKDIDVLIKEMKKIIERHAKTVGFLR